jgi:AbrB family looped-hinge helix DNA binding protein
MQLVSVTRKGQVTIPEEVRRKVGIRLGTKLLVESIGEGVCFDEESRNGSVY